MQYHGYVSTSAFTQALIRLHAPHRYFEGVRFRYLLRLHVAAYEQAIRGSEKAKHFRAPAQKDLDSGDALLDVEFRWIPSLVLEYTLSAFGLGSTRRVFRDQQELVYHDGVLKQSLKQRPWLGKGAPMTMGGMFFESTINHAAIGECVGSEVVWPGGFFEGEVQPKSEGKHLGRSTVLFELRKKVTRGNVRWDVPDLEDIFHYCDRFMIQIDTQTGLMLSNTGTLSGQEIVHARVEELSVQAGHLIGAIKNAGRDATGVFYGQRA